MNDWTEFRVINRKTGAVDAIYTAPAGHALTCVRPWPTDKYRLETREHSEDLTVSHEFTMELDD